MKKNLRAGSMAKSLHHDFVMLANKNLELFGCAFATLLVCGATTRRESGRDQENTLPANKVAIMVRAPNYSLVHKCWGKIKS